ncbi:putative porphobilinogen synthase [Helianthus anomalus]
MQASVGKMACAGADVVSPSDMMDGRVGAIRSAPLTVKVSNMCLLCPILQSKFLIYFTTIV